MALYTGEIPKALDVNLGTLNNLHPRTPISWDDVPDYLNDLRFVIEATAMSERYFTRKYGLRYAGARAAFFIAKETAEEELNRALRVVAHRENGGCLNTDCTANCFEGLQDRKNRFFLALQLVVSHYAFESSEL